MLNHADVNQRIWQWHMLRVSCYVEGICRTYSGTRCLGRKVGILEQLHSGSQIGALYHLCCFFLIEVFRNDRIHDLKKVKPASSLYVGMVCMGLEL